MGKKNTSVFINYEFDNDEYLYEVPYEFVIRGIENYFYTKYSVELDAKSNDIWNMCVDLNILSDIEDDEIFVDFLKPLLEDDARDEYEEEKEMDREFDKHFRDED